ncbi:MAG: hypothetical protein ACO28M_06190 [Vulcanococcus sp.]|jgi:hypothetical protein|uniref:hypothetical protein n=1 Tax=Vulcanococcus sp. TaxID=2856995 RepID=UPI003C11485D
MTRLPRRLTLLPLGLALSLVAAAPALAERGPERGPERGLQLKAREAEALATLSRSQRRDYFDGLRALERRRALQRQSDLSRLESCLSLRANASACVQDQQRKGFEQRLQWKQELRALRERYNLPVMQRR